MVNRFRIFHAADDGVSGAGASKETGSQGNQGGSTEKPGDKKTDLGQNAPGNADTVKKEDHDRLLQTHLEMKAKWEKREKEETARAEKALMEQGKFKELYDSTAKNMAEITPKFEKMQKTIQGLLDAEMKSIPENMKGLVPSGDILDQLDWISKAKASGLFGGTGGTQTPGQQFQQTMRTPPPGGKPAEDSLASMYK